MTCKTCQWLDVEPNRSGRSLTSRLAAFAVRHGAERVYPCTVEVPPLVLPASMAQDAKFHGLPWRRLMRLDEGVGCPFYSSREKNDLS